MALFNHEEIMELLQSSQIGLWKVEIGGDRLPKFYANAVMDELLGIYADVTPEERFRIHLARIHPDDMAMFQLYAEKLSYERAEVVYRYIHPVKGKMYVRCGGMRDDSDDGVLRIKGTHQDLTYTIRLEKDKIREQRLEEENLLIREKVREISDLNEQLKKERTELEYQFTLAEAISRDIVEVYILDTGDATVTKVKQQGNLLEPDERTTMPYALAWKEYIHAYVHPEDRELLEKGTRMELVADEVRRNQAYAIRYRATIDGEVGHYRAKFIYLDEKGGDKIVFGFRRIDEIVSAEQEQIRHEQVLMAELRRALSSAEAANNAKTVFLNNMTHDIRTPMNAILGFADLIAKKTGDTDAVADHIEKIRGSGQYLMSIINNVLDMARVESGRMTLNEDIISLEEDSADVVTMFTQEVEKKQIQLTKSVNVQHGYVIGDRLRLNQILINLISNAVKYTPNGGHIGIVVTEMPQEREGYTAYEMTVSDDGIGMSPEFKAQIFDPFSRERTTTESRVIGTGLGMSIVKQLVELMGGTIEVESEPGKGTAFTVRLEMKTADIRSEQAECDGAEQSALLFENKRVLIAEDNELNAEIETEILQEMGLQVEHAADGVECVDMLFKSEKGYYDMILMDIQMPNLNGYEAAAQIRSYADREKAGIPIIAVTANAFEEDRQKALAAGMNGQVAKPIDMAQLIEALKEALK